MVQKPLSGVALLFAVAAIGIGAAVVVLQEWAKASLLGAGESGCKDPYLGTLGLFESTYDPTCTKDTPYASTYYDNFKRDDGNYALKTLEFYPLFPSQNNFGGLFDTPGNTPATTFDNCKDFWAANGTAEQAAAGYVGAKLAPGSFLAADAGFTAGHATLTELVDTIWIMINSAVNAVWGKSVSDSVTGVIQVAQGGYIVNTYLNNALTAAAKGYFSKALGDNTTDIKVEVQSDVSAPIVFTNAGSGPKSPDAIITAISPSLFKQNFTAVPQYAVAVASIDAVKMAGVLSDASVALGGPALTADEITAIAGVSGWAAAWIAEYTVPSLLTDCFNTTWATCYSTKLFPSTALGVNVAEPASLNGYNFTTLLAQIQPIATNAAYGALHANMAKASTVMGVCSGYKLATIALCAGNLFTTVQEDLTTSYPLCLLAAGGGVIDAPTAGLCTVPYFFSQLVSQPELLGDAIPAEYVALLPVVGTTFTACGANNFTFTGCKTLVTNPAYPQSVDEQKVIPENFATKYSLCLSALQSAGHVGIPNPTCETFIDFMTLSAQSWAIANATVVTAGGIESVTAGIADVYVNGTSLYQLFGGFIMPCLETNNLQRSTCLGYYAGASTTDNGMQVLISKVVASFIKGDTPEERTKSCEDDDTDLAAISLAQILVPAGLGAIFVGMVLAIVSILKNNSPMSFLAGVLTLIGVGAAAGALLNVKSAPMFDLLSEDGCQTGVACYEGGIANTLGLVFIALGAVAGIMYLVSGCLNKEDAEADGQVTAKVDATY